MLSSKTNYPLLLFSTCRIICGKRSPNYLSKWGKTTTHLKTHLGCIFSSVLYKFDDRSKGTKNVALFPVSTYLFGSVLIILLHPFFWMHGLGWVMRWRLYYQKKWTTKFQKLVCDCIKMNRITEFYLPFRSLYPKSIKQVI